jgi:hypothetical protein
MYNEKSRKNLKMFTSKNQPKKKGRPRGSVSIINKIKEVLQTEDPVSKKQVLELLVTSAIKQAMKGNAPFFREIVERVDGKVTDKVEQTGKDSGPVIFHVVYDNPLKEDDLGES